MSCKSFLSRGAEGKVWRIVGFPTCSFLLTPQALPWAQYPLGSWGATGISLNLLCSNHFPAGEEEGGVQGVSLQPQQTPKGGSGAEQLCLTHGPGGVRGNLSLFQTAPFFPPSSFVKNLSSFIHLSAFKKKLHQTIKTRGLVATAHLWKKQQKLAWREKGWSRLSLATAAWPWHLPFQPRGIGCCRNSKPPPLPPRNPPQALEGLERHREFLPAAPAQMPAPVSAGSLRGRG